MRHPLKRFYGRGDLHFVAFSCYRRRPLLGTRQARDRFVKVLDEVRKRHQFRLIGYVVMPEHVHLLLSEPRQGNPSKVLQVLKQNSSVALRGKSNAPPGQLELGFANETAAEQHFWQRRFYDFNVYSEKKVRRKARLHARESGNAQVGVPSEGLAVEQLFILRQRRRTDPNRPSSRLKKELERETQNPHP